MMSTQGLCGACSMWQCDNVPIWQTGKLRLAGNLPRVTELQNDRTGFNFAPFYYTTYHLFKHQYLYFLQFLFFYICLKTPMLISFGNATAAIIIIYFNHLLNASYALCQMCYKFTCINCNPSNNPLVPECYYLHLTKEEFEALRCFPRVSSSVIKLIKEYSSVLLQTSHS